MQVRLKSGTVMFLLPQQCWVRFLSEGIFLIFLAMLQCYLSYFCFTKEERTKEKESLLRCLVHVGYCPEGA